MFNCPSPTPTHPSIPLINWLLHHQHGSWFIVHISIHHHHLHHHQNHSASLAALLSPPQATRSLIDLSPDPTSTWPPLPPNQYSDPTDTCVSILDCYYFHLTNFKVCNHTQFQMMTSILHDSVILPHYQYHHHLGHHGSLDLCIMLEKNNKLCSFDPMGWLFFLNETIWEQDVDDS